MRRLPVFFVIDCSESMVGQPLQAVQEGVDFIMNSLRTDPYFKLYKKVLISL